MWFVDFDEVAAFKTDEKQEPLLQRLCIELGKKLQEKDELLEQANIDMNALKARLRTLFEEDTRNETVRNSGKPKSDVICVSNVPVNQDEGYFSTYSHFGIHHDMLSVRKTFIA